MNENKLEGGSMEPLMALKNLEEMIKYIKPENRMFPEPTPVFSPAQLEEAIQRLKNNLASLPNSEQEKAQALLLQAEIGETDTGRD